MPYCEVSRGVRLYYEDVGDGGPVVFICGGQAIHKLWGSQVEALAGEFRTITFDWRGTQGRHDRKQRYEGSIYLANAMPNARLTTFENSAHMVNVEEAARSTRPCWISCARPRARDARRRPVSERDLRRAKTPPGASRMRNDQN